MTHILALYLRNLAYWRCVIFVCCNLVNSYIIINILFCQIDLPTTRNSINYTVCLCMCRTNIRQFSVYFQGPKLFNSLPRELVNIHTQPNPKFWPRGSTFRALVTSSFTAAPICNIRCSPLYQCKLTFIYPCPYV